MLSGWRRPVLLVAVLAVSLPSALQPSVRAGSLDPCAGTLGATTVDNHVCLNGETIKTVHEALEADDAAKHEEADTTFVAFNVSQRGRWVVMQNGTGAELTLDPDDWTDPLPGVTWT